MYFSSVTTLEETSSRKSLILVSNLSVYKKETKRPLYCTLETLSDVNVVLSFFFAHAQYCSFNKCFEWKQ